jgi:hypothetical protein
MSRHHHDVIETKRLGCFEIPVSSMRNSEDLWAVHPS